MGVRAGPESLAGAPYQLDEESVRALYNMWLLCVPFCVVIIIALKSARAGAILLLCVQCTYLYPKIWREKASSWDFPAAY